MVVAGGDGSLHALHHRDELGTRRVGPIPLGTGHDVARGSGLPTEPGDAAAVVRDGSNDLIVDGTGDVVVNVAHVGVAADAADSAVSEYTDVATIGAGPHRLAAAAHPRQAGRSS